MYNRRVAVNLLFPIELVQTGMQVWSLSLSPDSALSKQKTNAGRPTCQRYDTFWRLGAYGANCQTTCSFYNMSFDAPGLRLWEQRFR